MKINEPVSIRLDYDSAKNRSTPRWISWKNRLYAVEKIGLHHTFRQGRTLYHVFSVITKSLFFRLVLDTENLSWSVSEISDAL